MNDFLRNFIMKTIRKMIDSVSVPEWQVREYAIGWYSKGVLTEEDLQEIDERYTQPEPIEEAVENTEPISEENSEQINIEVNSTEEEVE